jgi:hypothetical protein
MDQLAFYNVGCEPEPGVSRLKPWLRRLARKVLLPASLRLVQILSSLCHRLDVAEQELRDLRNLVDDLRRRHEEQVARFPATIAFGWDYVAMVRRLAVLEEHVDALLCGRDAAEAAPALADSSVRFPGLESAEADHAPRSKLG